MSNEEFKKYPERIDNSTVDVCECSHVVYAHKGWMFNDSKKECEKCMCPQYKFKVKIPRQTNIEKEVKMLLDEIMDIPQKDCPKCKTNQWVRWAWCGKYHCTKCEWVFGKTPNTNVEVVEDQFAWWNK